MLELACVPVENTYSMESKCLTVYTLCSTLDIAQRAVSATHMCIFQHSGRKCNSAQTQFEQALNSK